MLVDFWTYSCINCLRTLPYVRAWDRALPRERADDRRRPHARVRVRARGRNVERERRAAPASLPGRARQRLRHVERLRATSTGRPSTWSTPAATFATTTSARASTTRRSARSGSSWRSVTSGCQPPAPCLATRRRTGRARRRRIWATSGSPLRRLEGPPGRRARLPLPVDARSERAGLRAAAGGSRTSASSPAPTRGCACSSMPAPSTSCSAVAGRSRCSWTASRADGAVARRPPLHPRAPPRSSASTLLELRFTPASRPTRSRSASARIRHVVLTVSEASHQRDASARYWPRGPSSSRSSRRARAGSASAPRRASRPRAGPRSSIGSIVSARAPAPRRTRRSRRRSATASLTCSA